jgi:hypothetical protein
MKKSILGSLVGIAIVVALDSFARVIISLYMQHDILMFAYSSYPGIIWPILLTMIAGFTSFFGGMFSLTYGRDHRATTGILFVIFLLLLRYGQLHLLIGQESLFYPITALVLSLGGAFIAWQLLSKQNQSPVEENTTTHHYPNDDHE